MRDCKQLQINQEVIAPEQVSTGAQLNFAQEAFVFTSLEYQIWNVNIAGVHLLGQTLARMERMPLFRFISLSDRHEAFARSTALLRGGADDSRAMVITILPPRRTEVTCSAKVSVMRNPSGRAVGFLWLIRNVTAEMSEEEDSVQLSQATEGFGHSTRGLVHELRNILTGIQINAEIAGIVPDIAEVRESLAEIQSCCERAAELLGQFRAFKAMPPALPDASGSQREEAVG